MKRNRKNIQRTDDHRRGSTLIIVIAMMGLLAFLGTSVYVLAFQERNAAENFSEGAKIIEHLDEDPFPWGLEQLIVGPKPFQKGSILQSPTNRHAMLTNVVGSDDAPHSGAGVRVIYSGALPAVDSDYDGLADVATPDVIANHLNMVDSITAWRSLIDEGTILAARGIGVMPEPDVDYTTPDINNMFLAYKGQAIRDNGAGATPRFELVDVHIPSFFRPQYLKSSVTNDESGTTEVPTDADWFEFLTHPEYQTRSFRPHPEHIGGYAADGTPVYRFFEAGRDGASPVPHGPFPFRASEGDNSANFGHLGVWTGHAPGDFELDSDNDGDGTKEGIWMDLAYPIQEAADGTEYAILHSFTIYDLNALINLNAHGSVAGLRRDEVVNASILGGGGGLGSRFLSESNQGLGPNEINPLFALIPAVVEPEMIAAASNWFQAAAPSNPLEQVNIEWLWAVTGRTEDDPDGAGPELAEIFPGRWGDANALSFHRFGAREAATLPRPGRAGNLWATGTSVPAFDDHEGFDDNQNSLEGIGGPIARAITGALRGFVHPLDYAGIGTNRSQADFRLPNIFRDPTATAAGRPEAWLRYHGFSVVGSATTLFTDSLYNLGRDGTIGGGDDLLPLGPVGSLPGAFFNALFEDPLEMIMDLDFTLRPDDQMFSVQDMLVGYLSTTDEDALAEEPSLGLRNVLPSTFSKGSKNTFGSKRSERFTTLSNTLRQVPIRPSNARPWEFTNGAFPPAFNSGAIPAYDLVDPFRPAVRRLLSTDVSGEMSARLPLSINHVLDLDRPDQAPPAGTTEYEHWVQRSGLRLRPLTEHPLEDDPTSGSTAAQTLSSMTAGTLDGITENFNVFPPRTVREREFWARRDRQMLARDIYVLLYTMGGAEDGGGTVVNYTGDNSTRTLYGNDRLRQMAQFAVNMVDTMDTDNVITRFEYDKNLGNGWNLDDNPDTRDELPTTDPLHTGNGLYPEDSDANRGVVYGVEAQQLTFSEVLAVRSQELTGSISDNPATIYDDTDDAMAGNRFFLHVELQNMLPMSVDLASIGTPAAPAGGPANPADADRGVWRLARFDRPDPLAVQNAIPDRAMTLMAGNGELNPLIPGKRELRGGDRFVIALAGRLDSGGTSVTTDPNGFGTADVYVSLTAPPNFDLISPKLGTGPVVGGSPPPAKPDPTRYLDVIENTYDTRWLMSNPGANTVDSAFTDRGEFFDGMDVVSSPPTPYGGNVDFGIQPEIATSLGFDLVLQRRLNPNLPNLPVEDNPWVEVDRIKAEFSELLDDAGDIDLPAVVSVERREPLDARGVTSGAPFLSVTNPSAVPYDASMDPDPQPPRNNTIGSDQDYKNDPSVSYLNSATNDGTPVFELWQAHFDRDFASVGELLNLPIVGPNLLTRGLDRMRFAGYRQSFEDAQGTAGTLLPRHITGAAGMFLQPDFPAGTTGNDNRWYRLLQFVEVPSRVNRMLGNYLNLQRLPGKLNVNMLRHREVYAGLIDDFLVANMFPLADANGNGAFDGPFLRSGALDGTDATPGGGIRDRWLEFINERDGYVPTVDPVGVGPVSMWLPGTPNSRPFRSLGYTTGATGLIASPTDNGMDETLLRRLGADLPVDGIVNPFGETSDDATNRHWLEPGDTTFHDDPGAVSTSANMVHRHQFLSKIMNNTTTVSNCFIVYGTAAYFEAAEDPVSGVYRVGGRMGLDLDGDGTEENDAGWERRAVFVIDRTELFNAYDPASGEFEWERLVKARLDLASDGQ